MNTALLAELREEVRTQGGAELEVGHESDEGWDVLWDGEVLETFPSKEKALECANKLAEEITKEKSKKNPLSTATAVVVGVSAAGLIGILGYLAYKRGPGFSADATQQPTAFTQTAAARAQFTPAPVSVGSFVLVTDIAASAPIIVQVTDLGGSIVGSPTEAKGLISLANAPSTMQVGQIAAFNLADALASSSTLAALAQQIRGQLGPGTQT